MISKYDCIHLTVKDKSRIVWNIKHKDKHNITAYYHGCLIEINEQDTGGFYAKVEGKNGILIVDGYFTYHNFRFELTLENVLIECLENILHGD
jgi:hypothetical protein